MFVLVVGPVIGAALPGGDEHALADRDPTDEGRRGSDWTVRGVLLLLSGVQILLGYGYLRPRVVGQTPTEFWGMQGEAE